MSTMKHYVPPIRAKKRPDRMKIEGCEELPYEVDDSLKVTWYNRAWWWLNGKKRITSVILTIGGNIALLTGNAPLGGVLFGVASLIGGVALAHEGSKKLNSVTSGDKINWNEIIKVIGNFIMKLLRIVANKPQI